MSMGWETIAKGKNAAQTIGDTATVRNMGDRLCRAHHASRKDKCVLYHHRDIILDSMGGSTIG